MEPGDIGRSVDRAVLSRREFLAGAAVAALGAAGAGDETGPLTAPESPTPRQRPTVVEVRSDHVVRGAVVHPTAIPDMLAMGLTTLTGRATEKEAWRSILSPEDVIGLKFNRSGAEGMGTTPVMAEALVRSLTAAGWDASRIVPIEIPDALCESLGTTRPRTDWLADEVPIGPAQDRLSGVLDQVTAIVNIPFIKHHNLAGLTCCLKNITHAMVKHPAQFHEGGCVQIADIMALPQIGTKVRLHIVNGLRVVTEGGPEAHLGNLGDRGSLLFGIDGVAVDAVALEILNYMRIRGGLRRVGWPGFDLPYLTAAASVGLGSADLHEIQWLKRPM